MCESLYIISFKLPEHTRYFLLRFKQVISLPDAGLMRVPPTLAIVLPPADPIAITIMELLQPQRTTVGVVADSALETTQILLCMAIIIIMARRMAFIRHMPSIPRTIQLEQALMVAMPPNSGETPRIQAVKIARSTGLSLYLKLIQQMHTVLVDLGEGPNLEDLYWRNTAMVLPAMVSLVMGRRRVKGSTTCLIQTMAPHQECPSMGLQCHHLRRIHHLEYLTCNQRTIRSLGAETVVDHLPLRTMRSARAGSKEGLVGDRMNVMTSSAGRCQIQDD